VVGLDAYHGLLFKPILYLDLLNILPDVALLSLKRITSVLKQRV
jgi:hypothetical protein